MYDRFPFHISYLSTLGNYSIHIDKLDPGVFGIEYTHVERYINVQISVISYYKNHTEVLTTSIRLLPNSQGVIDGSMLSKGFMYSSIHGLPEFVEFIVTPNNCYPMKWMIEVIR